MRLWEDPSLVTMARRSHDDDYGNEAMAMAMMAARVEY
jgi:hypothetical protein